MQELLFLLLADGANPIEQAKTLSEAGVVAVLIFFAILFLSAIAWQAKLIRDISKAQQKFTQGLLADQKTEADCRLVKQQDRDDKHKNELVEILEKALEKSQRTETVLADATRMLERMQPPE